MRRRGYQAEAVTAVSTDVVQGLAELCQASAERYPWSVFFAGQIVFPKESFWTRILHNQVAFAL